MLKLLCDDRTGETGSIKAAQLLTSGFTKAELAEPAAGQRQGLDKNRSGRRVCDYACPA